MAWRIRLATPADAALLPAVERSAGESFLALPDLAWIAGDQVTPAEAYAPLIAAGWVWTALDEADAPIGFLSAERFGQDLHIWELAVTRPHQQRGIGAALLAAAETRVRDTGMAALTLTTFINVAWNAPFYARQGYRQIDDPEQRLAAILAEEAARGLPDRCVMRKAV